MNFNKLNNRIFKLIISLVIGMMFLPFSATQAAKSTNTSTQVENVRIFFNPSNIALPPDTSLSLMVDTRSYQIAFARIDLSFDPTKIQLSGEIQPTNLLRTVIQKTNMSSANST